MEHSEYTLPGVMNFLRTEWQRKEQTKIEWDIERADMRSRISRLEAEKLELRRERDKAYRHLEVLYGKKLKNPGDFLKRHFEPGIKQLNRDTANGSEPEPENSSMKSNVSTSHVSTSNVSASKGDNSQGDKQSEQTESANGHAHKEANTETLDDPFDNVGMQEVSDELMKTVGQSQEYLKQCVSDIRHILRQTGSAGNDAEFIISPSSLLDPRGYTTLANFGAAAQTVAALPEGRVTAGTEDGNLLIWTRESNQPCSFSKFDEPVNCMRYSVTTDRIVVGVGTSLHVFDNSDVPRLETSHDFVDSPVQRICASPNGNLIAIVQANGATSVWSLQGGRKLVQMSEPASGVRVCDFAEVNGDMHLVLARDIDPTDPEGSEGNLLLADPVTGQLLKKIVFSFSAGISAIMLTADAIVLGTDGGDLRVLGLARGETLAEVTAAHRGEITGLNLIQGQTLLSTSIDGRVSLWSLPSLMWKGRLFSHDSGYGALCSSASETSVVVGGGDGIIRVYKESAFVRE